MHWKPNFFLSQGLICEIQECQCSSYLKPCFVLLGTIFAYGQSSSGKTFTMTGSAMHPGIIKLAVNEIFSRIDKVRLKYGIWWHTDNLCSIVNNAEVQKSNLLLGSFVNVISYWKFELLGYINYLKVKKAHVFIFHWYAARESVLYFLLFVHQIFFNLVLYYSCVVVICNIIQKAVASCRINICFSDPWQGVSGTMLLHGDLQWKGVRPPLLRG